MIIKTYVVWFTLLTMLLTACAEDVDLSRLPRAEPQPAVHCYLSPQDTVVAVVVSQSRTTIGVQQTTNPYNAVPDAQVTLTEGGRTVTLRYDTARALYLTEPNQLIITPNRLYALNVQRPDGRRVSGTTRVPDPAPTPEMTLDSVRSATTADFYDCYVQLRWLDLPGQPNYYLVAGDNEHGSIRTIFQPGQPYQEVPVRVVSAIVFEGYNESPFVLDERSDGRWLSSSRGKIVYVTINGKPIRNPPIWAQAYLLNVNQDYYQYHEAVLEQARARNNPFAEPVPVKGNLTGGFGCLAAYCKYSVRFRVQ